MEIQRHRDLPPLGVVAVHLQVRAGQLKLDMRGLTSLRRPSTSMIWENGSSPRTWSSTSRPPVRYSRVTCEDAL